MYYAYSKKGTLFKGDIIQGRTLFKEIRYAFLTDWSKIFYRMIFMSKIVIPVDELPRTIVKKHS